MDQISHSLWIRFHSSGFICLCMISVAFWTFGASGSDRRDRHRGRADQNRALQNRLSEGSIETVGSAIPGALSFVPKGTMPLSAGSCTRSGITAHCLFGAQKHVGQIQRVGAGRSHRIYSLELRVVAGILNSNQ